MARLIPLILLLLPFAEIATFILIGSAIGLGATLALVVLSIVLGIYIVRLQGFAHLARMRSALKQGTFRAATPVITDMLHSLLLAVAGILFIIPGFLTDLVAILLIIPLVRTLIGLWLLKSMTIVTVSPGGTRSGPQGDDVIEGEFTETRYKDPSGQPPILPPNRPPGDDGPR